MTFSKSKTAIANLMFENPMFRWIPEGENDLNVLVIGSDE